MVMGMYSAKEFQSTLPVWGATDAVMERASSGGISIHAPRVGSDRCYRHPCRFLHISIHAPRVGSDINNFHVRCGTNAFQSTLPVWGATRMREIQAEIVKFQSTLPVWGATSIISPAGLDKLEFQSTLPVWGATGREVTKDYFRSGFQSTLPVWGATGVALRLFFTGNISIHAPRVGSDQVVRDIGGNSIHFNPRSPCGERRSPTHGILN